MFCTNCGNEIPENGKFCPVCRTPVESPMIGNSQQAYSQQTYSQQLPPQQTPPQQLPPQQTPPQQAYPQQPYQQPTIIINNTNANANTNNNANPAGGYGPRVKNKWVAFFLCFFLGYLGIHKFYEGKILLGVVYIFTFALCGVGWLVDLIMLLMKPNPYSV